jgi:hypothetical protein
MSYNWFCFTALLTSLPNGVLRFGIWNLIKKTEVYMTPISANLCASAVIFFTAEGAEKYPLSFAEITEFVINNR